MLLPRSLMPSFQEMRAFEATARHGSFTTAGRELSLTQSAVSKQVRQLEDTLGVQLFIRLPGGVALTPHGERFLLSARRILEDCEKATHAIVSSVGSQRTLRIAVLPTFASRWLIPRLPAFIARHDGVTVELTTEPKPFDMVERSVDVAIHYGAPAWPNGDVSFLCREQIVAVGSPTYLRDNAVKQVDDLQHATLLQQATRPHIWQQWFAAVGAEHPYPYRGPMFDQFAMTSQAAVAGMGIALVPTFLIERELVRGELQALPNPPWSGPGAYYLVTPIAAAGDALVADFVDWMQGQVSYRPLDKADISPRMSLHSASSNSTRSKARR